MRDNENQARTMRDISNLDQHPETRKKRFPEHLWPLATADATTVDEWWILLEFLRPAGLSLEVAPTKLDPPSADFQRIIAGKNRLFELGEIVDSSLPEGMAYSKRESTSAALDEAFSAVQPAFSNCSIQSNTEIRPPFEKPWR